PPVPSVPVPSEAVPGVPTPPRPGFGRPAAPVAPAANQDNVPLADRKITESIIQPKLNGNELAALYKKYTGRRVIVSAAAAQAEFAFIQEAGPNEPLTYAEAAQLLKKAAVIENFVFVPDGDVDKLLVATGGANPKGNGLSVYDQTTGLPDGDEVVHYVMTLRYLKPEQAQQVFNQIVGQFGPYGSIAAVPNASALVITENTPLIRKLIELKDQIDKPSSDVGTRFIKVQYADVTELAQTLNEMLGAQQQAQRSASVQRAAPQPAAPNPAANNALAAAGEGGTAGEEAPVQIVPDARTNRIFAMGRPVDLVFVEGLVREFDTPSDNRNYLRRKLRFLSVTDFLPVAGDALNRAFSGNPQGGAGGGAGSSGANFGGNNRTASNNRGASTNSRSSSGTSTSSSSSSGGSSSYGGTSGSSGGSGSGGSSRGDALDAPNVSTAPQSLLVGRTLLVADNITNSIVVQGPPASVEIIQKLLDQVDVKAQQVLISTVFGQLSLNDDLDYGVQWLKTFNEKTIIDKDGKVVQGPTKNGIAGSQIGTPLRNLVDPRGLLAPTIFGSVDGKDLTGNFPATGGLSLYGTISDNLSVYLHALKASGKFSILSRPSIYTANNQKGMISSGQRIAVPTNSYQGGASTGISTNIEYRDVVLKLEVVPLVNSEHEVTLQIALVNDDIIGEQDVEGVGKVPTIGTRELTTTVTVPNNSTVILGGLITTSEKSSKSGIPLLMDIPYLGSVFSTTSKTKDRSELLIFIQPTIVGNEKELDRVQADVDGRYRVSPELRHFADGPGAIPPPDGIVPAGEKASDYQPKPEQSKPTKPGNNTFNRTGRHR
ncbi:MAG TPA: secretin N-terminal domain-containing protein, partial [Luteolibacter sp.]